MGAALSACGWQVEAILATPLRAFEHFVAPVRACLGIGRDERIRIRRGLRGGGGRGYRIPGGAREWLLAAARRQRDACLLYTSGTGTLNWPSFTFSATSRASP